MKETSTPGPGKMRVNYTVEGDGCTMLILSHPCLKHLRAQQSKQRHSSVPSFAYSGRAGNTKLDLFPLSEDNEEKASFCCKLCQGQVKFSRGGSNITYVF